VRRAIPFLLLGLLGAGTMAGLGFGLAEAPATHSGAGVAGAATSSVSPATAPLAPAAAAVPACSLVTATEARALLQQIVNDPAVTDSPYCVYEGIVVIAPAKRPPQLSVTEVVNPKTVASLAAILRGGMRAICAQAANGTSCASVEKVTHLSEVDGYPVIWSQTAAGPGDVTGVGTAVSLRGRRLVLVIVSNLAGPGRIALAAMGDVLPRL
jgi:hypothetical protein